MSNESNKRAVKAPRRDVFLLDPNEIIVIGVDTDHASKADHYLWDPRIKLGLDELLVRNIQTYGVLKPILVVKDGDQVLVVDGRQRVLHAREAAARQKKAGEEVVKVPVMFRRGEERYLFGVSRAANISRPDSVLTNAMNAQRMIDMGAEHEEVATAFGVKVSTLKTSWLPLLDLSAKVRNAVERGQLSAQAAVGLTGLSKAEQETHLEELIAAGVKPTQQTVAQKLKTGKAEDMPRAPTPSQKISAAMDLLTGLYSRYADGLGITAGDLTEIGKLLTGRDIGEEWKAKIAAEAVATQPEAPQAEAVA